MQLYLEGYLDIGKSYVFAMNPSLSNIACPLFRLSNRNV